MTKWILLGWLFFATPPDGVSNLTYAQAPWDLRYKQLSECETAGFRMVRHLHGTKSGEGRVSVLPVCAQQDFREYREWRDRRKR